MSIDPSPTDPAAAGSLTLQQWLDASEMSYSAFARLVPCSVAYPRMVAHGLARPSYEMACRFEELTDGMVSREQWYPRQNSAKSQQIDLDDM